MNSLQVLKYFKRKWLQILQYFNGQLMLGAVHFSPQQVHNFLRDGRLPSEKERIIKEKNVLDEFSWSDKFSDEVEEMDKVNIVLRGSSFKHERIKDLKGQVVLLNWQNPVDNLSVIYATGDQNELRMLIQKEMFPIYYFKTIYFNSNGDFVGSAIPSEFKKVFTDKSNKIICLALKSNMKMPATGSGLVSILGFSKKAKKMNIYGWDHYLKKSPKALNYFDLLKSMYLYQKASIPINIIACAIFNFHYAMRLSELENIKNYGRMGDFEKDNLLLKKLEKVFYK